MSDIWYQHVTALRAAIEAGRLSPWESWDPHDRMSGRNLDGDDNCVVVVAKNRGNFSCWVIVAPVSIPYRGKYYGTDPNPTASIVLAAGVLDAADRRETIRGVVDAALASLDPENPVEVDHDDWHRAGFIGDLDDGGLAIPWNRLEEQMDGWGGSGDPDACVPAERGHE